MTLEQRKKFAAHIQRLLKVRRVSFPIANTEKGPLSLTYTKDAQDFEIILDAVPLNMNDYDNRELKAMVEKYLFDTEYTHVSGGKMYVTNGGSGDTVADSLTEQGEKELAETGELPTSQGVEKKKRGRPAKGK